MTNRSSSTWTTWTATQTSIFRTLPVHVTVKTADPREPRESRPAEATPPRMNARWESRAQRSSARRCRGTRRRRQAGRPRTAGLLRNRCRRQRRSGLDHHPDFAAPATGERRMGQAKAAQAASRQIRRNRRRRRPTDPGAPGWGNTGSSRLVNGAICRQSSAAFRVTGCRTTCASFCCPRSAPPDAFEFWVTTNESPKRWTGMEMDHGSCAWPLNFRQEQNVWKPCGYLIRDEERVSLKEAGAGRSRRSGDRQQSDSGAPGFRRLSLGDAAAPRTTTSRSPAGEEQ